MTQSITTIALAGLAAGFAIAAAVAAAYEDRHTEDLLGRMLRGGADEWREDLRLW